MRALLDIGAEATCIDAAVLSPLVVAGALRPTRFVYLNLAAAGGLGVGGEYYVNLTIAHPSGDPRDALVLRDHPVIEYPLDTLGCQALLGRDLLARCVLIWDGPAQRFTLGY